MRYAFLLFNSMNPEELRSFVNSKRNLTAAVLDPKHMQPPQFQEALAFVNKQLAWCQLIPKTMSYSQNQPQPDKVNKNLRLLKKLFPLINANVLPANLESSLIDPIWTEIR